MSEKPHLLKVPLEPGGTPGPGKVSEIILDFAQPLMEFDQAGPPDIKTVRSIMMMATVCWNAPIMLARKDAGAASTVVPSMPVPLPGQRLR